MTTNIDSISNDLSNLNRNSLSIWNDANSNWNDSLSIQFEANYWDPLFESYRSLENAVDELSGQISRILNELP
jgi:hypothetical protein